MTVGNQWITATDTRTSSLKGTESNLVVQPAAARTITVTGFPSPDTAGTGHIVTVTAYDAYGNRATGYTGTVQFTSSDRRASLPASYTFTAADAGTHTFAATLVTAGAQSLTATDAATASITGSGDDHRPGGRPPVAGRHRLPQPQHRRHLGLPDRHGAGRLRQPGHRLRRHGPLHLQ